MSKSPSESDEIEGLQREVRELRAERKGRRPRAGANQDEGAGESGPKAPNEPAGPGAPASRAIGWPDDIDELSGEVERVIEQLESVIRARPVVALVAAFACGVLIGKLTPRRLEF
jgi:hypothetical protein